MDLPQHFTGLSEASLGHGPFGTEDSVKILLELRENGHINTMAFHMSRQRLCACSAFFTNALNGPFTESHTGTVTVRETSMRTFSLFKDHWLYETSISAELTASDVVDLSVFADYYTIPTLERDLLSFQRSRLRLCHHLDPSLPSWHDIEHACARLPDNAPLLKLWARASMARGFLPPRKEFEDSVPRSFLWSMLEASHALREGALSVDAAAQRLSTDVMDERETLVHDPKVCVNMFGLEHYPGNDRNGGGETPGLVAEVRMRGFQDRLDRDRENSISSPVVRALLGGPVGGTPGVPLCDTTNSSAAFRARVEEEEQRSPKDRKGVLPPS